MESDVVKNTVIQIMSIERDAKKFRKTHDVSRIEVTMEKKQTRDTIGNIYSDLNRRGIKNFLSLKFKKIMIYQENSKITIHAK